MVGRSGIRPDPSVRPSTLPPGLGDAFDRAVGACRGPGVGIANGDSLLAGGASL